MICCRLLRDDRHDRAETERSWLTPAERSRYFEFTFERRRRDWLLGRRVAKELVQALLRDRLGYQVPPTDFEVATRESGAPVVLSAATSGSFPWGAGTPLPIEVSISHSQGAALCGALWRNDDAGSPSLGVDLESIAPQRPETFRDIFTPSEMAYWAPGAGAQADDRALVMWSGKESALKALGTGLTLDPQLVTCLPMAGPDEVGLVVEPDLDWKPLEVYCSPGVPADVTKSIGCWTVRDRHALTLVAVWCGPVR